MSPLESLRSVARFPPERYLPLPGRRLARWTTRERARTDTLAFSSPGTLDCPSPRPFFVFFGLKATLALPLSSTFHIANRVVFLDFFDDASTEGAALEALRLELLELELLELLELAWAVFLELLAVLELLADFGLALVTLGLFWRDCFALTWFSGISSSESESDKESSPSETSTGGGSVVFFWGAGPSSSLELASLSKLSKFALMGSTALRERVERLLPCRCGGSIPVTGQWA